MAALRCAAQVCLTLESLSELIRLPGGQRVTAVLPQDGDDILYGTVRLIIEGGGLAEVPEGVTPPLVPLPAPKGEA